MFGLKNSEIVKQNILSWAEWKFINSREVIILNENYPWHIIIGRQAYPIYNLSVQKFSSNWKKFANQYLKISSAHVEIQTRRELAGRKSIDEFQLLWENALANSCVQLLGREISSLKINYKF